MTKRDSTPASARLHTHSGQLSLSISLDEDHIIETAKELLQQRFFRLTEPLDSSDKVKDYLLMQLVPSEREVFGCLFLDNKYRLIEFEILFQGSIDTAQVHPREVVKQALQLNAAAVIAAHNHPSGEATPSKADKAITLTLQHALATVGIKLLDHLILGSDDMVSLAEEGLITNSG